MIPNKFKIENIRIDQEIEKIRKKLLTDKSRPITAENKEIYGIEKFWIISKTGLALFNLENSLFKTNDELTLFAGFISALISLSSHLSNLSLSEVKIENISLHILSFKNYYFVSLITQNHDVSLQFLKKIGRIYNAEIEENTLVNTSKFSEFFGKKFTYLLKDKQLQKEIIIETSFDYVSKYIFGLIELDDFFKRMHQLASLLNKEFFAEYISSLNQYIEKIKQTNLNEGLLQEILITFDSIFNFLLYSENRLDENFNKYAKNSFTIFFQFYNKLFNTRF